MIVAQQLTPFIRLSASRFALCGIQTSMYNIPSFYSNGIYCHPCTFELKDSNLPGLPYPVFKQLYLYSTSRHPSDIRSIMDWAPQTEVSILDMNFPTKSREIMCPCGWRQLLFALSQAYCLIILGWDIHSGKGTYFPEVPCKCQGSVPSGVCRNPIPLRNAVYKNL